eukprot:CAMPEP_0197859270 /NCGR_PEP_ID=MMETSP1438-20131217/33711_1 /TAXON_ID=1461541 /ORGANISM="Pterosperma sp., Strain CCMP1384" /LENGTH=107 /DNA_ID=CAMNT_0043475703 /DNA_START=318 /DNA_END=638 /DNA_ORIENTATION=-
MNGPNYSEGSYLAGRDSYLRPAEHGFYQRLAGMALHESHKAKFYEDGRYSGVEPYEQKKLENWTTETNRVGRPRGYKSDTLGVRGHTVQQEERHEVGQFLRNQGMRR